MPAFFQKFENTVHALRVNKAKLTSGKAFIVDLFPLRGEKDSKYDKKPLFCCSSLSLDLSFDPSPAKDECMLFSLATLVLPFFFLAFFVVVRN